MYNFVIFILWEILNEKFFVSFEKILNSKNILNIVQKANITNNIKPGE